MIRYNRPERDEESQTVLPPALPTIPSSFDAWPAKAGREEGKMEILDFLSLVVVLLIVREIKDKQKKNRHHRD